MATNKEYNGWKNYQTWNCALWIGNDESLYHAACDYIKRYPKSRRPYANFINAEGLNDGKTPDGIKWNGTRLDYSALNEMMRELVD